MHALTLLMLAKVVDSVMCVYQNSYYSPTHMQITRFLSAHHLESKIKINKMPRLIKTLFSFAAKSVTCFKNKKNIQSKKK